MRVTYLRELKVKAELNRLEIENFVPMTYKIMNADTENPHRELVPAGGGRVGGYSQHR